MIPEEYIIRLLIFTAGLIIGWLAHSLFGSDGDEKKKMRHNISVVIIMVWSMSALFDMGSQLYETPLPIHGLVGIIAGYLFDGDVAKIFGRNGK